MVTTEPIYASYAPIYDAIEQDRFSIRMAHWVLRWLDARDVRLRRVLDLACGSGSAALIFAEDGCAVVGVDRSAAMLDIARGKARRAGCDISFVQADLRDLAANDKRRRIGDWGLGTGDWEQSLNPQSPVPSPQIDIPWSSFDLATCFCDSLNYLIGDGELALVFAGVARALRPGGYMVFDMNTEAEYLTWPERDVVTRDSRDYLVYNRLNYDAGARLATGRIVWFVREIERWWRGEEVHVERAWSDEEVCAALAGAGLTLAVRLDVEGREIAEAAENVKRMVYVAYLPY